MTRAPRPRVRSPLQADDEDLTEGLLQSCFLRKVSWQPPQPSLPSAAKAASVALTSPPCEVSASLPASPCARSAACLNWSGFSQITGSAAVGVCVLPGGNISGTYSVASAIASAQLLGDLEQAAGRAGQSVEVIDHHDIALTHLVQQP